MPRPAKRSNTLKDLLGYLHGWGSLWMVRAVYLTYLLKQHGVDADWVLTCKDKQILYEGIETLQGRTKSELS